MLRLRRYERISVHIRRFRSNGAGWPTISGRRGDSHQSFFFSETGEWSPQWRHYPALPTPFSVAVSVRPDQW